MEYQALLSINIQPLSTRAWLFDNQNGQFGILAGVSQATAMESAQAGEDLDSRVVALLQRLELESGHKLLDTERNLILRPYDEAQGVRKAALTLGIGRPLRTVLLAVSPTYSLDALRRLSGMLGLEVVLELSSQDDLNATAQLMALLQTDADLFLIAGGTNDGASRPLRAAIENLRILCSTQPRVVHPQVVFLGNEALGLFAAKELDIGANFHIGPNIQPEIDREDLLAGWQALSGAYQRLMQAQLPGLAALEKRLGVKTLPAQMAGARILRLIEAINPAGKGVLNLDLGSEEISLGAVRHGHYMGLKLPSRPKTELARDLVKQSALAVEQNEAALYMLDQIVHPGLKPATVQDMALDLAWQRLRIMQALQAAATAIPDFEYQAREGLVGAYEPIILSGESLDGIPSQAETMLMALDGIRPHGITTIVLDQEGLLYALGGLAAEEPMLAAQMLDAGIFENLGTVVNVTGAAFPGRSLLKLEVDQGEGHLREQIEVKPGALRRIEISPEAPGRLYLAPQSQADVGMGQPGLGGWLRVSGGNLGVIVDARGRPLRLPGDARAITEKRQEWLWELGA